MASKIIDRYLDEMVRAGASDMYLTVGYPPSLRINNDIVPLSKAVLQIDNIEHFVNEILDEKHKEEFADTLELNFSINREDNSRFRFNLFRQQLRTGMTVRKINTTIPDLQSLLLPDIYKESIMKKRGIIVLASPGGSGKSTSMAAMIGYRNHNGKGHILTIEDPIEFVHEHKNCIITQREVGSDTYSYGMALKNALRQRADVIAIGEVRDREGMDHALRFAETGHLCIITLHSNNASQAIDRMINFFPDDARNHVLTTLSQNLLCVMSQRLVMRADGGNCLAIEILRNEGLLKTLIADDKLNEIRDIMERGKDIGMQTFDQHLFELYRNKIITLEVARAEADNPAGFMIRVNQHDFDPISGPDQGNKYQF